jgi:NAD+ kinase
MTIGVVGTDADSVVERIQTEGRSVESTDSDPIPGVDSHVAIGEPAVLSLVRNGVETPILPLDDIADTERGPRESWEVAIDSFLNDAIDPIGVPSLAVEVTDHSYRALMDVMVVTEEPARISEYEVRTHEKDRPFGGDAVIDRVRADGVVAATPIGSRGYAGAAGGAIVDPNLFGLSIVSIGPFRVEQPHWVLDPPISLSVVRESAPVRVLVDDRSVSSLDPSTRVVLSRGREFQFLPTPASDFLFGPW